MSQFVLAINNPNDPTGKWHSAFQWVFEMIRYLAADGQDEPIPPFGKAPTPEEDAACDTWLRKTIFLRELTEQHLPDRRSMSWLYARLLVAQQFVDSQIRGHAHPPQFESGNDLMLHLLVDRWYEDLRNFWSEFSYDGKYVCFRGETILVRSSWQNGEDPEEADDGTAVTWKNLHNFAEMLAAALSQRAEMKLPFGEMPSREVDAKCDRWFKKFFASDDPKGIIEKAPADLVPWLAARMIVATGLAFGNMEFNPHPPTEKALWIALRNIVITKWNSSARQLWPGIYMKEDGKIGFRGDPTMDKLQSKGLFFSMN